MSTLINGLPRNLLKLNGRALTECLALINALPTKLVILNGTRINRYVLFNQCSTPKTREIKWTQICLMSTLINALPPKASDIK